LSSPVDIATTGSWPLISWYGVDRTKQKEKVNESNRIILRE